MTMMKKWSVIFLVFSLVFLSLGTFTAWAEPEPDSEGEEPEQSGLPFDVDAHSALLMEATTGKFLFEKDIDTPFPPASITKNMTLLLAIEAIEEGRADWNDIVVVSENAWRMKGSEMFLEIGQEVTVEDLLKGISVVSANDACVAIAEHLYGSEAVFVQKMNEKARELGLTQTRFENSTGLPHDNHYMSARDIATLAAYIVNNHPKILELESQLDFTFNDIFQRNRNPLLGRYPGADGLKTGWTNEAGYCLVGTAKQNDLRLISVVLNSPSDPIRLASSEALLNFGFANYTLRTIAEKGEVVGEAPLPDGKSKEVEASTAELLGAVITPVEVEKVETVIRYDKISAPIQKGDKVGEIIVMLEDEELNRVDLLANQDVERTNFVVIAGRKIGGFFRNITGGIVDLIKGIFE